MESHSEMATQSQTSSHEIILNVALDSQKFVNNQESNRIAGNNEEQDYTTSSAGILSSIPIDVYSHGADGVDIEINRQAIQIVTNSMTTIDSSETVTVYDHEHHRELETLHMEHFVLSNQVSKLKHIILIQFIFNNRYLMYRFQSYQIYLRSK
jgi:hypothetical protein